MNFNAFRTLRVRKEDYDQMCALRGELMRRGLNIVPSELLPEKLPDGGVVTVSLIFRVALNALRGMLVEEPGEVESQAAASVE